MGDGKIITGVDVKVGGLPGMPPPPNSDHHCQVEEVMGPLFQATEKSMGAAEGDEDSDSSTSSDESNDDVPVDVAEIRVPESQRTYMGWKISYRNKKPEKPLKARVLRKNANRNRGFAWLASKLPKALRHMPVAGVDEQRKVRRRRLRQKLDRERGGRKAKVRKADEAVPVEVGDSTSTSDSSSSS